MRIVYATESAPESLTSSIFLAGPSPRHPEHPNWRIDALRLLEEMGYDGVVFVPLTRDNQWSHSYTSQLDWETKHLNMADVILFWVPRNLETLPAFTTNIEFGTWMQSGKAVVGWPHEAVKMDVFGYQTNRYQVPVEHTLADTIETALDRIGEGAKRTGRQREVPLHIWRTQSFQAWLKAQEDAGNHLDGAKVEWVFRVGPKGNIVFFWCLHVDVYIAAEDRHKTNEVVLSRPDISTIVAYCEPPIHSHGELCYIDRILDTKIAIIKEFRSPAATADGYIRELPGGSSWKPGEGKEQIAADELNEETGLSITGDRLEFVESRQVSGTLSAHFAHTFVIELSPEEMKKLKEDTGIHGVEEDTERTYVDVTTVRDLVQSNTVDWANMGMILCTLLKGK